MATKYVTQSGAGAHDGTSLANAWSVSEHNAASLSAGDVVSINGTLTSVLQVPSGGSSGTGNDIRYLYAPGAESTSACWSNSTGAIDVNQKPYITIDGGGSYFWSVEDGIWVLIPNGVIKNTDNGTGLGNSAASCGINATNANHLTIQGMVVQDIYVRTAGTDLAGADSSCIRNLASVANGLTGFRVLGCNLNHAFRGIESDFSTGCSNYEFAYNSIRNCCWGTGVGDRSGASTLSGLSFHGNNVRDWSNWVDTDTERNAFHANGFFAFGNAGTITGIQVYGNKFGPGWSNDAQTSGVYINTNVSNVSVYNNLFVCSPGEYAANGLVTLQSSNTTTLRVMNNTFIAGGESRSCIQLAGSGNGNTVTILVENNLGDGGGDGTFIAVYNNANVALTADYNLGYNFNASLAYSYSSNGSGDFKSFAQWQALGFDAHGLTSDPNLDVNFQPEGGSPAISAGINLSALFTDDYTGDTRTLWSIGAFDFPALSLNITTLNATTLTVG